MVVDKVMSNRLYTDTNEEKEININYEIDILFPTDYLSINFRPPVTSWIGIGIIYVSFFMLNHCFYVCLKMISRCFMTKLLIFSFRFLIIQVLVENRFNR